MNGRQCRKLRIEPSILTLAQHDLTLDPELSLLDNEPVHARSDPRKYEFAVVVRGCPLAPHVDALLAIDALRDRLRSLRH